MIDFDWFELIYHFFFNFTYYPSWGKLLVGWSGSYPAKPAKNRPGQGRFSFLSHKSQQS